MSGLNLAAVLVAALSAFVLGGLWYSPLLFGRIWNREAQQTPQQGHPAKVFGLAFLFAVVSATAFAVIVGPAPPPEHAIGLGALTGGCVVAASFGINYQFAQRSLILWLIDGGYFTMQFLIYGVILGLWH